MGNVDGSPTRTRNRIARLAALALAPVMLVIDGGPPGVNQSGGRVTGRFTVPQRGRN